MDDQEGERVKLPLSRFALAVAIISLVMLVCYPVQWLTFVVVITLMVAAIFAACGLIDKFRR